jgi:hypothetical protein
MPKYGRSFPYGAEARITSGCSKRTSSKAVASEEARLTLRYVELLSDARTPIVDFFSILLDRGRGQNEDPSLRLHVEETKNIPANYDPPSQSFHDFRRNTHR